MCLNKRQDMDNIQNCDSYINTTSLQAHRHEVLCFVSGKKSVLKYWSAYKIINLQNLNGRELTVQEALKHFPAR
jgi:hypothetical protein